MDTPFEISASDITGYGQKDVYAANGSANYARTMGGIQFDPIVPRGQRPTRVRDLFPVAATSAALIDYFRVTGYAAGGENGNAAPVGEYASGAFVTKPKSNLVFESVQAPVRTIAHFEAAHRNVLDDVPQLQALIDNELMYGLRLEEDNQILNGAGGDGLTGILQTTGVQAYSQVSSEVNSDALRRAATKVILSNYQPTGYVLHPNDWENTELQRGEDGQYMLAVNVAIGADTRIWRLPVVETPAIAEGKFLAGAFGLGAQVYDRQVANVRIAEQHSDFFIRNAVAVLAEQRLALAVKRPEAFVVGTWYSE
jgi:HK97 family phage major capsid protein